jgi:regulator of protease activity HflC (stomatin/prohibitin superfamily)
LARPYHRARPQILPANTIIKFVPQQEAWIVERFGKFHRVLDPGLAILVPIVDSIRHVKTLKEVAVLVPSQSAITQDNVTISLDGVLYYRILDPYKASYGIEDADFAVTQLAQTTMRSEIGKLTLDRTLAERTVLNANIVEAINDAASHWGIKCLRYEIRTNKYVHCNSLLILIFFYYR